MAYRGSVFRWQIFLADLEPAVGREQAGESRPVLILSNDDFNAANFDVVAVLPLTKLEGKKREVYPFEVVLPEGHLDEGLTPIVQPYQIRTISKMRLLKLIGGVQDPSLRQEIEDAVLEHLGIEFSY